MMKYDAKGIFIVYIIVAVLLILMICLIYFFNIGDLIHSYNPKGTIAAYWGSTPPKGWVICDGTNGTPDLRGKFVYGGDIYSQFLLPEYRSNDNIAVQYMIHLLNPIEGGNNLQTLTTQTLDTNILSLYNYANMNATDKDNFDTYIEDKIVQSMNNKLNLDPMSYLNIYMIALFDKKKTANEAIMDPDNHNRLISNPTPIQTDISGDVFLTSDQNLSVHSYTNEGDLLQLLDEEVVVNNNITCDTTQSDMINFSMTSILIEDKIQLQFTPTPNDASVKDYLCCEKDDTDIPCIVIVKKPNPANTKIIIDGAKLIKIVTITEMTDFFETFSIPGIIPTYIPVYDIFELDELDEFVNINDKGLSFTIKYGTDGTDIGNVDLKPILYSNLGIKVTTPSLQRIKDKRFIIILKTTRNITKFNNQNQKNQITITNDKFSIKKTTKDAIILDEPLDFETNSTVYHHKYNTIYNIIHKNNNNNYSHFTNNNTYIIKNNNFFDMMKRFEFKDIITTPSTYNISLLSNNIVHSDELVVNETNMKIHITNVEKLLDSIKMTFNKQIIDSDNIYYQIKYSPSNTNLLPSPSENGNTVMFPADDLTDVANLKVLATNMEFSITETSFTRNEDKIAFKEVLKGGTFLINLYEPNVNNKHKTSIVFKTPLEVGYTIQKPNYNGYKYPSNKSLNADMNLPPYVSMIFIMKT